MTKRKNFKPDYEEFAGHINTFCGLHDKGKMAVTILEPTDVKGSDKPKLVPIKRAWHPVRGSVDAANLEEQFAPYMIGERSVFYTVNSFSEEEATTDNVCPSCIAQVDADGAMLPSNVPKPSYIVRSSEDNEHWFWFLDRPLPAEQIQHISKALTKLTGGDAGGHSPTKQFRAPGFFNFKYTRPFRVNVAEDNGIVHGADVLLALAQNVGVTVRSKKKKTLRTYSYAPLSADAKAVNKKYRTKLSLHTNQRLLQRKICAPFTVKIAGKTYAYHGDDRSQIYWSLAKDFHEAGATRKETGTVITESLFWQSRAQDGREEDIDEFLDKIFDYEPEPVNRPKRPLNALDPADLIGLPVPERSFAIPGLLPDLKATLLSGDGATGKTKLATMLAVAFGAGKPFLDIPIEQRRVYAFLGENDDLDTHIELDHICRHYGVSFEDLRGQVIIAPRAGFDNLLMTFKDNKVKATKLFDDLMAELRRFRPGVTIIETAADTFGGQEMSRSEVRQYVVNVCERIARETNGAVMLCAHPSVSGMSDGRGYSGSTGWSNSVRSRLYLYREYDEDGDEIDPDVRILEVKKANFGQVGQKIRMRWKDHAFVLDETELDPAIISEYEQKIIDEIGCAFDDGMAWSLYPQARHRYIVPWIKLELHMTEKKAKDTINRLLKKKKIFEVEYIKNKHKKGLCTERQFAKLKKLSD